MRRATTVVLPLLIGACSYGSTGPVPTAVIVATEPTGTLVVSWTIDTQADRNVCTSVQASAVRVQLTTAAGGDAGSFEQSCSVFSTSIRLDPDTYQGSAVMLDVMGAPISALERVPSFTILGGDVITTRIDFAIATFTPD